MTAVSRQARAQSQPRRGLRRGEAATYLGLSPGMFDQMVKQGRLPTPIKFGSAAVWDRVRLDQQAFGDAPSAVAKENEWDDLL